MQALLASLFALLPLLLQLPRTLGLGLGGGAILITALAWRRPLRSWLRLLLMLVMLAGVFEVMGMRFGRDTGCALLAAMLAIKPSETFNLRDARSLLGFALFAPFAAFLLDQGPLTMLLGLATVLCALLTMQRLADAEAMLMQSPLHARLGRIGRLMALGLPLALTAFWLFPRLVTPLWGVPERALSRPGLSDSMSPSEWLDLIADDSPALRVTFNGPVPKPEERYWRGPVLWDFDGVTWTALRWLEAATPPDAQLRSDVQWNYRIELEPTDRRQLVALDLPSQSPEGARLSPDHNLTTLRPLASLTRWELHSAPSASFEPELSPFRRRAGLQLPPGRNPRTLALAAQWRREAGTDDAAIIQRAMQWIHAEFAYTLDTPAPGQDGVDEFLFDYQKGFCQHFSSAFVVLMRGAGIPARVVTGYAGGVHNPLGDYWIVRQMDAHAWAEVWLPQRGWVRVDPTAAVAPERIYDTLEDRLGAGGGGILGQWSSLSQVGDWLRHNWNDLVLGFDANRQQRLLQSFGIDRLKSSQLLTLFGLLALLSLGAMVWMLARGERERDPLLRAWHRLGMRYARFGLARQPSEPAGTWAERVVAQRPQAAATLVPLSQRFAESRYAVGDKDIPLLLRDLRRHRP